MIMRHPGSPGALTASGRGSRGSGCPRHGPPGSCGPRDRRRESELDSGSAYGAPWCVRRPAGHLGARRPEKPLLEAPTRGARASWRPSLLSRPPLGRLPFSAPAAAPGGWAPRRSQGRKLHSRAKQSPAKLQPSATVRAATSLTTPKRKEWTMTFSRRLWLGLLALVAPLVLGGMPVFAQQPKPNIVFIMGDDIGWMQPSIYHQGLMVGETPNIDRIGQEGARFTDYYAEQSCTAGRNAFFTGMHPLRTGMIPPQLPGQPVVSATRHPGARVVPARSRLQHRRVRQEPSGRPHRCIADRARLP